MTAATKTTWLETTWENYNYSLEVLPPAAWGNEGAFQVGEPSIHKNGRPAFPSFKMEGEKYLTSAEPLTFREFAAEVSGAVYTYDE